MLYPMLWAVPAFGAGAATGGGPLDVDAGAAAADCEAMTLDGFTVAGFAATVIACAAAFITMRFCRSCASNATDPLCGSESMAWARLFAPLPFGLIILAPKATPATSRTATRKAGSTMPVRRNKPRLRRELRRPPELRGLVVELCGW